MIDGRSSGTMALTEPNQGSTLADITTSARLHDDNSYLIRGQKIYISNGDHDLSENIVHLVLARMEGRPAELAVFLCSSYPSFWLTLMAPLSTK